LQHEAHGLFLPGDVDRAGDVAGGGRTDRALDVDGRNTLGLQAGCDLQEQACHQHPRPDSHVAKPAPQRAETHVYD
jgi:hypothetical protein